MNKNLRRSVVALATAFACLGLMASPASAHTHTGVVTGGTITATGTGVSFTGTLGGTAGVGCSSTLVADVDHVNGTVNIAAFASVGHFVLNGNHYVATITRTASTSGTIGQSSTTSGTINSPTVSLNVVIRAAANNSSTNEDCTTTGTTICTLRVTLHVTGTYTHTGTGSIESSNTVSLNATSVGTITFGIGTCQVPFSSFFGGTASVTGSTGHVTT